MVMKPSAIIPIFSFLLLLALPLLPHLTVANEVGDACTGNPFTSQVCDKLANPLTCKDFMNSIPVGQNATLKDLARMALRSVTANATLVKNHTSDLVLKAATNPKIRAALIGCLKNFVDVLIQLAKVALAVESENFLRAIVPLLSVVNDIIACDQGFNTPGGTCPAASLQIADQNQNLILLVTTILSIFTGSLH